MKEDIYFIRDVYNKIEFSKDENVPIKIGVINKKQYPIYNVTIYEEIPASLEINNSSIVLEQNGKETILSNQSYNYFKILNSNNHRYLIDFGTINNSNSIYIKFNIASNKRGKYVFNPAILNYKNQIHENRSIKSLPIYIDIIDNNPTITRIQIKPNPVKKDILSMKSGDVLFTATFEDIDKNDLRKCELWSSIDGVLDERSIYQSDDNRYIYEYSCDNLSEGTHTITFKVFDKDNEYREESIDLAVEGYIFNTIPTKYDWTILIAIFAIYLEIVLKPDATAILLNRRFKVITPVIALSIFSFLLITGYIPIFILMPGTIIIIVIFIYKYEFN